MSIKAHIALGTLLGLLLGAGVVAVLSHTVVPESAADSSTRDDARDDAPRDLDETAPAAFASEEFRRPMRPGAHRRLLQS